jgi:hypothetical protein
MPTFHPPVHNYFTLVHLFITPVYNYFTFNTCPKYITLGLE